MGDSVGRAALAIGKFAAQSPAHAGATLGAAQATGLAATAGVGYGLYRLFGGGKKRGTGKLNKKAIGK